MKLKPYPKTKPSGVEWLGDVPGNWEVNRLKYSVSINDETLSEATSPDYEFEYVDIGSVNSTDGISGTEFVVFENAPSRARRKVRNGDTIVSTVRTYLRAIAPIKNAPDNLIVSTGFAVVRPRKVEPSFLGYALRESSFVESVVSRSTGVSYPAVNASEIGRIPIPLPPPTEQTAIAAYLDRETGRIDELVGKKRELIERLKEKRTALISRTVTRGLPADLPLETLAKLEAIAGEKLPINPPLKPSGIEWVGDVPEHWDIIRLGRRIELQRGVDITKDDQTEGPVPVVSSGGASSYHDQAFCNGPGVVVGRKGTVGSVHWVEPDYWPHDTTLYVRDFRGNNRRYVFYKLLGMELAHFDTGSANPTLNRNLVHPVPISWPPVPEQRAIAAYLDEETAKLDALVAKVEAAIERLQEYRSSLITAAVTGKLNCLHKVTK